MGAWTIEIKGHGIHDNGREDDADAMATAFVKALAAAGHEVKGASFVLTGHERDIAAELRSKGELGPNTGGTSGR